jgi:hypothetical protein
MSFDLSSRATSKSNVEQPLPSTQPQAIDHQACVTTEKLNKILSSHYKNMTILKQAVDGLARKIVKLEEEMHALKFAGKDIST